jgi:hypothetical protein
MRFYALAQRISRDDTSGAGDPHRDDPLKGVQVPPIEAVTVRSPRSTLGWFAGTPSGEQATSPGTVNEEPAVRDTLVRYRTASNAGDTAKTRTLWPTASAEDLKRAFERASAQKLDVDRCEISVAGNDASSLCQVNFASVAHADRTREPSRAWLFQLRKQNQAWTISTLQTLQNLP